MNNFPFASEISPAPELVARLPYDRRTSVRYRSRSGRAWIGWREGRGFGRSAAWILDISQGGAMLAADRLPPHGSAIWLCLDDPNRHDWFEASIIELRANQDGPHLLRIAFPGTCPYALFKFVVWGPQVLPERPK